MKDKSVHLIVTAPPYWQPRNYDVKRPIGFHDSYESYINNLNLVWSECNRVLREGCRMCIHIGDQFARPADYGRYKVIPIRTEIIRFCETVGMDYMGAIIWQKKFPANEVDDDALMGSFPYPRSGVVKMDYEFILIFRKQGSSPSVTEVQKMQSVMTKEEWNTCFSSHWTLDEVKQEGYITPFPDELPTRLIKMFSFFGETVFDPFMGTGTTALAAKRLGRNSVGYDIDPECIILYKSKLHVGQPDVYGTKYAVQRDSFTGNVEEKIAQLPYIFSDLRKPDKKAVAMPLPPDAKTGQKSGRRVEEKSKTLKWALMPPNIE